MTIKRTSSIHLGLLLHNHQPVGNFPWVFQQVFEEAYLPMIEALEQHPKVRMDMKTSPSTPLGLKSAGFASALSAASRFFESLRSVARCHASRRMAAEADSSGRASVSANSGRRPEESWRTRLLMIRRVARPNQSLLAR